MNLLKIIYIYFLVAISFFVTAIAAVIYWVGWCALQMHLACEDMMLRITKAVEKVELSE